MAERIPWLLRRHQGGGLYLSNCLCVRTASSIVVSESRFCRENRGTSSLEGRIMQCLGQRLDTATGHDR